MNSVNPVPRSATRPWPSGRAAPLPKPATGARPPMPARRSGVWRAVSASISDASPVWGRTAASSRTTCGPSSGPINAPEVAIFGVAKAATRPHWNGHELLPRPILPHSLSWDHWAVDGVAAGRFLAHLADLLGDPRRLLL